MRGAVVYFAHCRSTGLIKVGVTHYPVKVRVAALPRRPTLMAALYVPHSGYEARVHNLLFDAHERGEWFRLTDQLLDVIQRVRAETFSLDELPSAQASAIRVKEHWAHRKAA